MTTMLVVENTEAQEIKKFYVLDAMLQLGEVQIGQNMRTFSPTRATAYFTNLENHLYALVSRYLDAFLYVPRRTYSHLAPPPILNDIYASVQNGTTPCWLVDQFLLHPLASIGDNILSDPQRDRNVELCRTWAYSAPYGPRYYISQDLRVRRVDTPGWGCIIRAADLLRVMMVPYKMELMDYIHRKMPVLIELNRPAEIDTLLEWLVLLRKLGVNDFRSLFFAVRSHREWGSSITRLVDIPGTKITTSGATVNSLLSIIKHLRETRGEEWATGIAFASNYPQTQAGDSIAEILSLLLSRRLEARPEDLQLILGGNLLVCLPPTPSFLRMSENEQSIVASGTIGRAALKEFMRLLQVLASRGEHSVISVGYTASGNGRMVDTNSAIITVKENTSSLATNLVVRIEGDHTLRISGWRRIINEGLTERRSELLTMLVRSATTGGALLESPSHLSVFTDLLLKCLRITDVTDIHSAMHFSTTIAPQEPHTIGMSGSDISALGIRNGDLALVLDATNPQWWVARVNEAPVKDRTVTLSNIDASLLGVDTGQQLDVLRFEGEVVPVKSALFAFTERDETTTGETIAYVHLHEDEIARQLTQTYVGKGTRLWPIISGSPKTPEQSGGNPTTAGRISVRMVRSTPEIAIGSVGDLSKATLSFRPQPVFADVNIILCMIFNPETDRIFRRLRGPTRVIRRLTVTIPDLNELKNFLDSLAERFTARDLVALIGLHTFEMFSHNRSGGRFGIVTVTTRAEKFSIQKGTSIQSYLELEEEMEPADVRKSVAYFILDALEEKNRETDTEGMFRAIAELIEDFGESRPTLVVIVTDRLDPPGDNAQPFLRSLSQRDRYHICLIRNADTDTEPPPLSLSEPNIKITEHHIDEYNPQQIESIVLGELKQLLAS